MNSNHRAHSDALPAREDRGMMIQPIAIIWWRKVPYVVDIPACRKALVRRQVEGELTNMASLASAAKISRSTASRFFSRRSVSLAATLRILSVLRQEFGDVCQPAADNEVEEWQRQEKERRRQDEETRRERQLKKRERAARKTSQ